MSTGQGCSYRKVREESTNLFFDFLFLCLFFFFEESCPLNLICFHFLLQFLSRTVISVPPSSCCGFKVHCTYFCVILIRKAEVVLQIRGRAATPCKPRWPGQSQTLVAIPTGANSSTGALMGSMVLDPTQTPLGNVLSETLPFLSGWLAALSRV